MDAVQKDLQQTGTSGWEQKIKNKTQWKIIISHGPTRSTVLNYIIDSNGKKRRKKDFLRELLKYHKLRQGYNFFNTRLTI